MKHHVFSPAKDVIIPQHFDSKFKRLLPIFGVSLNDKNLTNGDGTNKHTIIVNILESISFLKTLTVHLVCNTFVDKTEKKDGHLPRT